jgi:hypothetical protein
MNLEEILEKSQSTCQNSMTAHNLFCTNMVICSSYPHNRSWRHIGLWDVKDPTLFRQSVYRWRQGCKPYTPAALYSPETLFLCFWCCQKD